MPEGRAPYVSGVLSGYDPAIDVIDLEKLLSHVPVEAVAALGSQRLRPKNPRSAGSGTMSSMPAGPAKVLLIESNVYLVKRLSEALRLEGFEVMHSASGGIRAHHAGMEHSRGDSVRYELAGNGCAGNRSDLARRP